MRSAVGENPMLRACLAALCVIDAELLTMKFTLRRSRPSAGQGQFAGQKLVFCQLCYATKKLKQEATKKEIKRATTYNCR